MPWAWGEEKNHRYGEALSKKQNYSEECQPGFGKDGRGLLTSKVVQVREGWAGELAHILARVSTSLVTLLQYPYSDTIMSSNLLFRE